MFSTFFYEHFVSFTQSPAIFLLFLIITVIFMQHDWYATYWFRYVSNVCNNEFIIEKVVNIELARRRPEYRTPMLRSNVYRTNNKGKLNAFVGHGIEKLGPMIPPKWIQMENRTQSGLSLALPHSFITNWKFITLEPFFSACIRKQFWCDFPLKDAFASISTKIVELKGRTATEVEKYHAI